MLKKIALLNLLFLTFWSLSAQQNTAAVRPAKIFLSNNYRTNEANSIMVKWFLEEVLSESGVWIYRQEKGRQEWEKISPDPLKYLTVLPSDLGSEVQEATIKMFNYYSSKTYPVLKDEKFALAMMAVQSIKDEAMARLMGLIYIDRSAQPGKTYRYKITEPNNGLLVDRAISAYIKCGIWKPSPPPQNIVVKRERKQVNIKWEPDPENYFGVDIFRKTMATGVQIKLTPEPSTVDEIPSTGKYPEVFFVDYNAHPDSAYEYTLFNINFFFKASEASDPYRISKADLVMPLYPYGMTFNNDTLKVKMTWKYLLDSVPDLAGFKVYRSTKYEGPYKTVHRKLLKRTDTSYVDEAPRFGEYYYSIAAIDSAANESNSPIFLADIRDVLPPDQPRGFEAKADSGQIVFSWKLGKEPDLAGYYVYKALLTDSDFVVINKNPVAGNVYIEKMPKKIRNKFKYRLVAVDSSANRSEPSKMVEAQMPDVTPPNAPFIKQIKSTDSGIYIFWIPNVDADLKNYVLFRRDKNDKTNKELMLTREIPNTDTMYIDRYSPGGFTWYYSLAAIDSASNISLPSKPYPIAVSLKTKVYEAYKIKAEYNTKNKAVELSWSVDVDEGFDACVLYRKATNEVSYVPITGKIKSAVGLINISDKKVQTGRVYSYLIKCFSVLGEVKTSAEINVEVIDK